MTADITQETCREELLDQEKKEKERCGAPAEFILWGKLLPPEALGPRCYDHAAGHVGHRALGSLLPICAIFDLRKDDAALERAEKERDEATALAALRRGVLGEALEAQGSLPDSLLREILQRGLEE